MLEKGCKKQARTLERKKNLITKTYIVGKYRARARWLYAYDAKLPEDPQLCQIYTDAFFIIIRKIFF